MACLAKSIKLLFAAGSSFYLPATAALCFLLGMNSPAMAASFTIVNGQVETNQQTLKANETGTIEAGGQLNIGGVIAIFNSPGEGNITVLNNGSISTTEAGADGILSGGADAVIMNSGALSTTGNAAHGIFSFGASAVITNNGALSTTGDDAFGIFSAGANAVITHSGTINVTGANSDGVRFTGANSTLTNSGTISASGNATSAILGGGGVNTLNLQTGSQIIGTIDLAGGTDTVNISGANHSTIMTILNAETFNLNVPGVVNGNVVATVDPTGQSIQGPALSTLTSAFHNVISQRLAHTQPLPPVQLASLELAPGMLFQERAPIAWGEVFGSHRSRGNDGLALAYDHDYVGFTGGYERDLHKARVGLFAGFAQADAETDVTSIRTDTDSFFGGGYAHFYLGPANLTASVAIGVEDHENDRSVVDNLAGIETARSDFHSVFFSPSLTLSAAYKLNEYYEFRPSATLNYTVAWYDSYRETGTTRSNLSIDDRTDHALVGRLQLALAMAPNATSELEFRTGVIVRYTDQDDVNASLAGTSFQYAATGDSTVPGAFAGGNLRFNVTDKLDLMGDVEYIGASGDESDISARLRVEYRF